MLFPYRSFPVPRGPQACHEPPKKRPAARELIVIGLRPGLQHQKTSFDASGSRRFDLILDAASRHILDWAPRERHGYLHRFPFLGCPDQARIRAEARCHCRVRREPGSIGRPCCRSDLRSRPLMRENFARTGMKPLSSTQIFLRATRAASSTGSYTGENGGAYARSRSKSPSMVMRL